MKDDSKYATYLDIANIWLNLEKLMDRVDKLEKQNPESEANLKQGTIDIVFGFHDPTTLKLDIDNEHFGYFLLGQTSFDDIVRAIEFIIKKYELQKVVLLAKPGNKNAVQEVLSGCHAAKCIFEMRVLSKKEIN